MKIIKLTGSIILLLLVSCNSSRITHSWKSKTVSPQKYNKILVLSLNNETDFGTAQKMETHMVDDLTSLGYTASSSLSEYGPKAFRKMDEETVINKLQHSGFDAVITIVLLNKSQEKKYVPGSYWNYFNSVYDRIYTPGYYATNTRYFWESNLYDVRTSEMLYSVKTESFDPASSNILGHNYGKIIVRDMLKKKVLNRRQKVLVEKEIAGTEQ